MKNDYDAIVLGAGFFGLRIAQHLRECGLMRVLVLEAENEVMLRASYVNQARVHNGYHYPRSILTAFRSSVSSNRFIAEYEPAIKKDFDHIYAVARTFSKTNSRQFEEFCRRVGAPLVETPKQISEQFSSKLIEKSWIAQELAFDTTILKAEVLSSIEKLGGVEVLVGRHVLKVERSGQRTAVRLFSGEIYESPIVIASLYAGTNELHHRSGLELLPIQYEAAEMALVRMPVDWEKRAVTVMDGPFFSLMPFPSENLHTFSHVRYTPQIRWEDKDQPDYIELTRDYLSQMKSSFREMHADAVRYLPALREIEYVKSIREIKTVLARVDLSDRRPVVVRSDFDLPGYSCVLGGKIDNIFDVLDELDIQLGLQRGHHE